MDALADRNQLHVTMRRIAFTGPESSGKSTLAKWVADQFGCTWVTEVARDYLTERNGEYEQADLDVMANEQVEKWDLLKDEPFVVYDTEMTVFEIWSKVKYGEVSSEINALSSNQQIDHYFLCSPDIPWEEDPLRENPTDRDALFALYKQSLVQKNVPFTVVSGSLEQRQQRVLDVLTAQ
jgi:nicotinamide riboside kinase